MFVVTGGVPLDFGEHTDEAAVVAARVGAGKSVGEDPPPRERVPRRRFVADGTRLLVDALNLVSGALLVEAVLWRRVSFEILDDRLLIEAVGVAERRGVPI